MARGWWLFLVALVSSCSPGVGPGAASPSGAQLVQKGADAYTTSPTSNAVRGGALAERLDAAVAYVAGARGMRLTGDGRLADLASFVASNIDADGRPPASGVLDSYGHHVGLIEPVPLLMIFG